MLACNYVKILLNSIYRGAAGLGTTILERGMFMCLNSQEYNTQPMEVGQTTEFGQITGHYTGKVTVALPTPAIPADIKCLCMGDGVVLRLCGLSEALQQAAGLVSPNAVVVFHTGRSGYSTQDRVEFIDTGSILNLTGEFAGVGVVMLAKNPGDYTAALALSEELANSSAPEAVTTAEALTPEPVLVGVNSAWPSLGNQDALLSRRGSRRGM